MAENIHKGHRERMRRKFRELGFDGFENHEILEMLLFYSNAQCNTNEIAHRLIDRFHTITAICDADINELMEIKGIGEQSAILLKMIPLLSRKYIANNPKKTKLEDGKTACNYFRDLYIGETNEKIRIVCLNDKLEIIAGKVIFEGSPGSVNVSIRNIVEYTYQNKCENIMLAHNHPNGVAVPSDSDIKSNTKIYNVLSSVGINLLDHIIVANDKAVSMNDTGAFSFLK